MPRPINHEHPCRVALNLPARLLERLDDYCGWHGISRTLVIQRILNEMLDQAETPQPGRWYP